MIKKLLTIVLGSFLLFSCSSDDSDDSASVAAEKIWVFVSTNVTIKKCDITANGQTADLLDLTGQVVLDSDEKILVWSLCSAFKKLNKMN